MQNENNSFMEEINGVKPYDILSEPPKFIRTNHAVKAYSLSRSTIVKYARMGGVLFKIGGTLLIEREESEAFLRTFRVTEDEDVEQDYGIIHISEAFDLMPGNIDLAAMEV